MTSKVLIQGHYQQDDVPERGAIIVDPDTKTVKIKINETVNILFFIFTIKNL